MKVQNTPRAGAPAAGRASRAKAPKTGSAAGAAGAAEAYGAAGPLDVATIQGIPQAELTPHVRVALDALMAEVRDLRLALSHAQKRIAFLEDLADRDSLAPVLNRRAFVRELARMISFAERYGAPGSVLYFDINGMKAINDRHGHGAGDLVVKHAAESLLGRLRGSDLVGRLGGDEFGVILTQADYDAALAKARILAHAIEETPVTWNSVTLDVKVSYGVYTFAGGEAVEEALDRADKAMYAQKRGAAKAGNAA